MQKGLTVCSKFTQPLLDFKDPPTRYSSVFLVILFSNIHESSETEVIEFSWDIYSWFISANKWLDLTCLEIVYPFILLYFISYKCFFWLYIKFQMSIPFNSTSGQIDKWLYVSFVVHGCHGCKYQSFWVAFFGVCLRRLRPFLRVKLLRVRVNPEAATC